MVGLLGSIQVNERVYDHHVKSRHIFLIPDDTNAPTAILSPFFCLDMPQQSVKPNQLKTFVMASYRWVRSVPYHIAASTASPSRLSAQNRTLWRRLIRRRRSVCRRNTFREWSPKSSDVTRMVDEVCRSISRSAA